MEFKRMTLLAGHYGSGKTNIAVNLAFSLKKRYDNIVVADMDIVNPYFRTKDSTEDFEKAGIKLIASRFAGSNVDLPSLPQEMYALTDNKDTHAILDTLFYSFLWYLLMSMSGRSQGSISLPRTTWCSPLSLWKQSCSKLGQSSALSGRRVLVRPFFAFAIR